MRHSFHSGVVRGIYDLDTRPRFAGIAVALAVLVFVGYKVFFSLRRS
jgi:hypothetical protein